MAKPTLGRAEQHEKRVGRLTSELKWFVRMLFVIVLLLVAENAAAASSSASVVAPSVPGVAATRGGASAASSFLATFLATIKEARQHLVAAAAARGVSIFIMYPVDTIKTRVQMDLPNPLQLSGIYKGVTGSLVGQVPYGVLTFGSYEMYKKALLERFPNVQPLLIYAISAVLGDVTGSGWLCPSEVVKQKLQAGKYENAGDAIRGIFETSGLKGFYQGYFGGLARDVPFRVAQLTSYEVTKNIYRSLRRGPRAGTDEINAVDSAICGAIAGTFSAAITVPLDRIKTLLMTDDTGVYGGSVAKCIATIWKQEGLQGFASGMIPRVSYIAPSVMIFFITYEAVQRHFAKGSAKKD